MARVGSKARRAPWVAPFASGAPDATAAPVEPWLAGRGLRGTAGAVSGWTRPDRAEAVAGFGRGAVEGAGALRCRPSYRAMNRRHAFLCRGGCPARASAGAGPSTAAPDVEVTRPAALTPRGERYRSEIFNLTRCHPTPPRRKSGRGVRRGHGECSN